MKHKELVLINDCGLDAAQMQQAKQLHAKFPQIAVAHREVEQGAETLKKKYFKLLDAIRTPAEGVKLNGKEIGLLLQSLGYPRSRVSEMRKVIEVSDPLWEQYRKNVIGFRPLLKIARGEVATPEGGEGGEDGDPKEPEPKKKKPAPIALPFPEGLGSAVSSAIADSRDSLTPQGANFYQLRYMNGKRSFLVTIEVSEQE